MVLPTSEVAVKVPIQFPPEADEIYEEAKEFRSLSSTERLDAILDLMASSMALMEHSPHREASLLLQEKDEEEWRKAQKELFARHGR
jgi:hypothetical protein